MNIIQTSRLTLIEAPSGFGKTTSMRTYLNKEEFNEFNIYWYTSFGESHEKTWQQIYDIFKKIDIKAWEKLNHGVNLFISLGTNAASLIFESFNIFIVSLSSPMANPP